MKERLYKKECLSTRSGELCPLSGKVSLKNKKTAKAFGKIKRHAHGRKFSSYLCDCGNYHLTTKYVKPKVRKQYGDDLSPYIDKLLEVLFPNCQK